MPKTRRHFCRRLLGPAAVLAAAHSAAASAGGKLRAAFFQSDATPPMGEPLIWVTPARERLDPLLAKGVILEQGTNRWVLCTLDWCGLGGSAYDLFRTKIAAGASTEARNVALQSVHQHTAPYLEGDGCALLTAARPQVLTVSPRFLEQLTDRLRDAVKDALSRLEPVDRIGTGMAKVEQVASARRIFHEGQLLTRYSTSGKDPLMARLPEGAIDPFLRTVSLAKGSRVLVRLHYYATHPQTFCCDGRLSADFVGAAREEVQSRERIPQIYFTGCSGDITVGKYNDSSDAARARLKENLAEGMRQSIRSTRYEKIAGADWKTVGIRLPGRDADFLARPRQMLAPASSAADSDVYRAAIALAFARRESPLELSALFLGKVCLVHLPGEPMLLFQKFAQSLRPSGFVAVAGYGDISPGYLCAEEAFGQGGYEPSAANAGPGTEKIVKEGIGNLLGAEVRPRDQGGIYDAYHRYGKEIAGWVSSFAQVWRPCAA